MSYASRWTFSFGFSSSVLESFCCAGVVTQVDFSVEVQCALEKEVFLMTDVGV